MPAPAIAEVVDETQLATVEQEAQSAAGTLLAQARALTIDCADAADVAAEFRNEIVDRRKAVEDWFRDPVAAAHALHKTLTTRRAKALEPFAACEQELNRKIVAWESEQRRIRQEAEAAAETERQRLMEEERLARAVEAEAAGDKELAERIIEGRTPQPVPHVPVVAPAARPVAGVTLVRSWKVGSVDVATLIKAAASRPEWARFLQPNLVELNKVVKALGAEFAVPGVSVVEDSSVRTAARR